MRCIVVLKVKKLIKLTLIETLVHVKDDHIPMVTPLDLEKFWDFVKISKTCGAFDEESFNHFLQVYLEDYEDFFNSADCTFSISKRFRDATNEVKETLRRASYQMQKDGYPLSTLEVFNHPDSWIDHFTEVAAFRQILASEINSHFVSAI